MSENVEPLEQDENDAAVDSGTRQRSKIAFPYTDFDNAYAVAAAIHGNVGHGTCSIASQLAAWMGQSPKSSGYRVQLAAARLFGLIESDDPENYRLSELGRRVVDQAQARAAKAEAFLNVPLFKALFEKYKSGVTPPSAALEREIAALGVAEKQKARARQVFESSAQQTGFREIAPNRLVMPAVVIAPLASDSEKRKSGDGGDGTTDDLNLDPLLIALLRKIPARGDEWPAERRVRWFKTFAMNVSQVYDDDANPVELEIELKK